MYHNKVKYKEIIANNLIFAEGFRIEAIIHFLMHITFRRYKGRIISHVHAPDLKSNVILKSSRFCNPYW